MTATVSTELLQDVQPPATPRAPRKFAWHAAIVLTAMVGAAAVVMMTGRGPALSTDSLVYLRTAALLEQGYGLLEPHPQGALATPHFPPLYPLLLSALSIDGADIAETARRLNVALFVINVLLIAALAWRATGRAPAAATAAALFAASSPLIGLHVWAWSEPLFLALLMTSLLLLTRGITSASRGALGLAALATAAACLTRYAGVALLIAGCAGVVMLGRESLRRRLLDAVAFATIAAAPLALWLLRNHYLWGVAVNRSARTLGFDFGDVEQLVETILAWLMPLPLELRFTGAAIFVAATLLAMASVTLLVRRRDRNAADERLAAVTPDQQPPAVMLRLLLCAFVVCYVALVLIVIGFLDSTTLPDNRILAPVQVALIIGVVFVGARAARVWRVGPRPLGPWIALGAIALVGINVYVTVDLVRYVRERGVGLASRRWAECGLMKHAARIPRSTTIYTNRPELIEIHLDRRAEAIPRRYNASTRTPIPQYDARMRRTAAVLRRGSCAVVWFTRGAPAEEYEPEHVVSERLRLATVHRTREGTIYRAKHEPLPRPAPSVVRRRKAAATQSAAAAAPLVERAPATRPGGETDGDR